MLNTIIIKIRNKLQKYSFRTGIIVLLTCIPFYMLSFLQMTFSISVRSKGILWIVLFGLAKIFQYGGLTILGVEGIKRIKRHLRIKSTKNVDKRNTKD